MPELDGYETLARIKSDDAIKHIPVIMITAVDELESVIRCIEMGATDYLHKPFNGPILQARISASLATKRLRDLELEYLEQVGHVTAAAGAVETATFDLTNLNEVAERSDALGQLARVFQRMAREVRAREERLEQTVRELRIEIDEARQAKKVAEITESEYFQRLRGEADSLRKIMGDARNTEK
jgi:two-component system cell cycle response regulator